MPWVFLAAAVVVRVAAAAAAGQGQCEVLDLSLQPSHHPLPTNLTVRPSASGWHLKFILGQRQTPPAACVRVEEIESRVALSLFGGHCDIGTLLDYSYLPRDSFTPHNWTIIDMNVTSDTVFVRAPERLPVRLRSNNITLPSDGLQVTGAQGVEAAVGCRISCPVHHYASEGPDVKKKVGEWQQDSLHFYFRPGPAFSRLHYEVVCRTRQDSVFNRDVEIKPKEEDAAGGWHMVKLEQQERKATVRLNGRPLQDIQLPVSCTASMHIIWTVGDGSFGFSCNPRGAEEPTKDEEERQTHSSEAQASHSMHPAASAAIAILVTLGVVGVVAAFVYYHKRKKKKSKSHKDQEAPQGGPATQKPTEPAQQQQKTDTPREPAQPPPLTTTIPILQQEQKTDTPREPTPPPPLTTTIPLLQQQKEQEQETEALREPVPPEPPTITTPPQQQHEEQAQEAEAPRELAPLLQQEQVQEQEQEDKEEEIQTHWKLAQSESVISLYSLSSSERSLRGCWVGKSYKTTRTLEDEEDTDYVSDYSDDVEDLTDCSKTTQQ